MYVLSSLDEGGEKAQVIQQGLRTFLASAFSILTPNHMPERRKHSGRAHYDTVFCITWTLLPMLVFMTEIECRKNCVARAMT